MKRYPYLGPQARAIVGWTVVFFVAVQLVLTLFLEARSPEIYDPEYRDRLVLLRQRVREEPQRPLLLVVGSSRITTDFRPEILPPMRTGLGERPLPFNYSHTGAGPLLNLVQVRRLLRQGLHPRWLVVEVVPPLLAVSGQSTAASLAEASDLPLLRPYVNPWKLYGYYLWERLRTCIDHRDACFRSCAPWLMTQVPEWDMVPLDPLGGTTKCLKALPDPEEIRRRTEVVRSQYYPGLQRFRIGETPDRAMRELLRLCREEKIELVLVLTPESSVFREWYPSQTKVEVKRYCQALSRENNVPVIDARDWLPDSAFCDGHHATPEGATQFTLRLGLEVLEPLVEGH